MKIIHGLRFNNIRGDVFGRLTTAVVARLEAIKHAAGFLETEETRKDETEV